MRQVRYNSICRQVVAVLGQCIVWRKNKASALLSWCGIKGLFSRQLDKFFECGNLVLCDQGAGLKERKKVYSLDRWSILSIKCWLLSPRTHGLRQFHAHPSLNVYLNFSVNLSFTPKCLNVGSRDGSHQIKLVSKHDEKFNYVVLLLVAPRG